MDVANAVDRSPDGGSMKGGAMPPVRVPFVSQYSRRMPDPVFSGAERHVFMLRAADVPAGIPLDPNPRDQDIDRRVYRRVMESLCEPDDGSFHLKNKGITIVADSVKIADSDKSRHVLTFLKGQGIVDGGHTYKIVLAAQGDGSVPDDQWVKVEVLVGIPEDYLTDIADGLNTSVQVQEMSLANLAKEFDWIKETLAGEPFDSVIAYKENEADKELDVRDVIAYMDLFNIERYPNDGQTYPITAYRAKLTTLKEYRADSASFRRMRKILPDILRLADIVRVEARDLHNSAGGKAGNLSFMEHSTKGKYFPFADKRSTYWLSNGVLFPMLGAFRWMVTTDKSGNMVWKGSFKDVLALWRRAGAELMTTTQATSEGFRSNRNAIGKNRNHWAQLHSTVIKNQLLGLSARR